MKAEENLIPTSPKAVFAYFSMEIAIESAMPTYSGGLGVLAGDALRAAADLGLPVVGLTLIHRKGYFRQRLDGKGNQTESPVEWTPEKFLEELPERVSVDLRGRQVFVRAWRYSLRGIGGHIVPIFFLDSFLPDNAEYDSHLTDHLYGGDEGYRLAQEALLGFGGVAMLRKLGFKVDVYHMNEGHSSLLALALLQEQSRDRWIDSATDADRDAVRHQCVFTTHTPVPAGHDQFSLELVRSVLGDSYVGAIQANGCCPQGVLNMTYLALFFSRYINGVSIHHEEVSQGMFPNYPVSSITNGVDAAFWATRPFAELFDGHIPEWRRDNHYLRYAIHLPLDSIQDAHSMAKRILLQEVGRRTGSSLDPNAFTIGFARRATQYKRPTLIFGDLERLRRISKNAGKIQIVLAGKAHPRDWGGKEAIRQVFSAADKLGESIQVVYLDEYDMDLARLMCGGSDLWLNTPHRPMEASGTSGMKAAVNGVPSLSILDGWWVEGHMEGITGWAIGTDNEREGDPLTEVESLYDKLEFTIVPMYYKRPSDYAMVMRSTIALNASFFNAQRMMMQYAINSYRRQ